MGLIQQVGKALSLHSAALHSTNSLDLQAGEIAIEITAARLLHPLPFPSVLR